MIIFKPLDSSCCWLHSWLEERDDWIKLHYDMTVPVRPPLGVIVEGPVSLKGRPVERIEQSFLLSISTVLCVKWSWEVLAVHR